MSRLVFAEPVSIPIRTYMQTVTLTFASEQDAREAMGAHEETLRFAQVYDDRRWALSARWDDNQPNSLNMREHMAKFGLKGTFYLNKTDDQGRYGRDFALRLMQDGFSIGGHTQSHPKLPEVAPNVAFWEIMANRIEREAQVDGPMNSFAFPFGQYKSDANPLAFEATTLALQRSGYHHSVYLDFARKNPFLAEGEFSTVLQVVPGDRVVDADTFRERLNKVFQFESAYAQSSRCISLGVHAWQPAEELNKLDTLLAELSGKSDWWYCNQNEYAAYHRQVRSARLEPVPGAQDGRVRRFILHRPEPAELGDNVPLTWVIKDVGLVSCVVDGRPVAVRQADGRCVVNLPHSQGHGVPTRVDHVTSPADPDQFATPAEFPGLAVRLNPQPEDSRVTLSLKTNPDTPLGNVRVTFRLPMQYREGVLAADPGDVVAGTTVVAQADLPPVREDPAWSQGAPYWVAEVDFVSLQGPGRIFVTIGP
ncbi:MAG: polysaccharide deacetylase family protein [Armatimonadetes bacterium]|nr:polysaccharide deacetylase family protein [Armatimonadota bacterium]